MKMRLIRNILTGTLLVAMPLWAQQPTCRVEKLDVERLPDLNVPRGGHQTLIVGDEIMVAGGHTCGFVPTATAEFLRLGDREWRLQPTIYIHDMGTSVQLRSGEVLLMGGAAEPLGIGQTHSVERYDPVSRTFEGFGCLDTKRMYASAEQLADGQVLVTGNWCHRDAMEVFDGERFFTEARSVGRARTCPHIFPTADGDALILGSIDSIGGALDYTSKVERLHGDPIDIPLLRNWQPIPLMYPHPATASAIGEGRAAYDYLTVMVNRNSDLRIALVETSGREQQASAHLSDTAVAEVAITLLPGLPPLPKTGPEGQKICFFSTVLVDREARRGYVVGHDELLNLPQNAPTNGRDSLARHYVFAFDYEIENGKLKIEDGELKSEDALSHSPSSMLNAHSSILYYTDPLPGVGMTTPVLLPSGDLVLVAGVATDNFAPFSSAYLLPVGQREGDVAVASVWHRIFPWLAGAVLLLFLVTVAWWRLSPAALDNPEIPKNPDNQGNLLPRIRQVMEERRLYLRPDLKVSDIAETLGVPRRAVSECLSAQSPALPFAQFVNAYRITYAQQLLLQHPDKKMVAVGEESGFANETSFFRTFKAFTGMTPKEWVQREA